MESPELIEKLRDEGGFSFLPLLGNTDVVAGAHLTRFALAVISTWCRYGTNAGQSSHGFLTSRTSTRRSLVLNLGP